VTEALEVLTIRAVAEVPEVSNKTVDAVSRTGELPAFKTRALWPFRRADLARGSWAQEDDRSGLGLRCRGGTEQGAGADDIGDDH
jgi:hypothetical protein